MKKLKNIIRGLIPAKAGTAAVDFIRRLKPAATDFLRRLKPAATDFLRRLKPAATSILCAIIYLLFCGFRLPADSAKELIPVETLQNQINNFKLIAVIALFIVALSILANVLLMLYCLKLQNQLSEMIQAFKNFNASRDAVQQIAEKVRIHTQSKDDIEILKKGL